MFSSLFKLASATVRSNVAIGGCRGYPRYNPVSRILQAKNIRPSQQNDVEYEREAPADYYDTEEKFKEPQMNILKPKHMKLQSNEALRYDQYQNEKRESYEFRDEMIDRSRNNRPRQNVREFDYEENETEFHDEKEIVELNPDEVIPINEELKTISKEQDMVSRLKKKKIRDKNSDHDRTGVVEIGENVYRYKVLGRDTKDLAKEAAECKSSKNREKNQKIILEGKRLIYDALRAGVQPLKIYFTRTEDLKKFKFPLNIELYKICYEDLCLWSNVKTSQGVLGIFKLPSVELTKPSSDSIPLTIICDQIREPGNMGSIIRVAASVGCSKLILTKGCVDIWDGKVLRSAAGAHFRIPMINSLGWEEIKAKLPEEYSLYLADNETPLGSDDDEDGKLQAFRKKFMVSDNVPLGVYHTQNFWGKKSVVLVIGGETIGLSLNAYELAVEKLGKRIYIPVVNGVESLNSGVALSVLSYEMRRQYFSEKIEEKSKDLSINESYQAVGLYSE